MGTTTSQSKLLLNEICVSVVIVGLEGLEPPDSEENAFTERPATNYGL